MKKATDAVGSRKDQDMNNSEGVAEETMEDKKAVLNRQQSLRPISEAFPRDENYACSASCPKEHSKIMICTNDEAAWGFDKMQRPRKLSNTSDSHFIPRSCRTLEPEQFHSGSYASNESKNGHLDSIADKHCLLMNREEQNVQPASARGVMERLSVASILKDNQGEFSRGDQVTEQGQLKGKQDEQVYQIGKSPLGNGNKKPQKTSRMPSKKRNHAIMERISSWSSILTFLLYGMHSNLKNRLRMKQESLSIWLAWGGMIIFTAFLSSIFLMVLSGARFTCKQIIFFLISATLMNILTSSSIGKP